MDMVICIAMWLCVVGGVNWGLWGVAKFDRTLEYLVKRWGWTWLQNDPNAWRKKYPKITSKIDDLEKRLQKLEKKNK